jgi:hypothetical protein
MSRTIILPLSIAFNLAAVGDVDLDSSKLSDEVILAALANGFKQKMVDYASGQKAVSGPERKRCFEEMRSQLYEGTWNKKRGAPSATDFDKWLSREASKAADAKVKELFPSSMPKDDRVAKVIEWKEKFLASEKWVERAKARYVPPTEVDLDL